MESLGDRLKQVRFRGKNGQSIIRNFKSSLKLNHARKLSDQEDLASSSMAAINQAINTTFSSTSLMDGEHVPLDRIRHAVNVDVSFDEDLLIQFAREALESHNLLRSLHNSPPLQLSEQLCTEAQNWANFLAKSDSHLYRNQDGVGENLLLRTASPSKLDQNGDQVSRFWYKEGDNFDLQNIGDTSYQNLRAVRHFTQMIWVSSKLFGIGKAVTPSGKLVVVANYLPGGNVSGMFAQNVLPKASDICILFP
ncbi:Golgi-associated plant pathogenesis-related protein 1 [Halotydeus destructor]|nr:Golgi-associated plant pathogenesis-related protein 1 [Halotydeus destructor]